DVLIPVERLFGLLQALLRQGVLIELLAHARAAHDLRKLLLLEEAKHLVDDREGEGELRRDVPSRRAAGEVDRFDDEVEDEREVEAGLFDRLRLADEGSRCGPLAARRFASVPRWEGRDAADGRLGG